MFSFPVRRSGEAGERVGRVSGSVGNHEGHLMNDYRREVVFLAKIEWSMRTNLKRSFRWHSSRHSPVVDVSTFPATLHRRPIPPAPRPIMVQAHRQLRPAPRNPPEGHTGDSFFNSLPLLIDKRVVRALFFSFPGPDSNAKPMPRCMTAGSVSRSDAQWLSDQVPEKQGPFPATDAMLRPREWRCEIVRWRLGTVRLPTEQRAHRLTSAYGVPL